VRVDEDEVRVGTSCARTMSTSASAVWIESRSAPSLREQERRDAAEVRVNGGGERAETQCRGAMLQ
jgi:hypothetical protein